MSAPRAPRALTDEARWTRAAERRAPLLREEGTTAFRWLNGAGDGVPGVTVDGFDGVVVLSLYRHFEPQEEARLAEQAKRHFGAKSVYLKRRPKEAHHGSRDLAQVAPPQPLLGVPTPEWEAREDGLRFRIRPADGLAVGLYLDMREGRRWVQAHARGRKVLNTFAYTCGFGVAARAGGASRVVNLDASKKVLSWGGENVVLNGFELGQGELLAGEAFDQLRRLARRKEMFDLVVLDPPSFSAAKGHRFSVARDYGRLVGAALAVLEPGGQLLACCNLASLTPESFEAQLRRTAESAGRKVRALERLGASPIDFPVPPGEIPPLKVAAALVK